jgi:hypothetical protein
VLYGIVADETIVLHPAVGGEGTGADAENPTWKELISCQKLEYRERVV